MEIHTKTKNKMSFFLKYCVHFLHFSLLQIVEVDIFDIAMSSGITNMVKAIILVINNTPQKLIVLPNTQILGISYTPY